MKSQDRRKILTEDPKVPRDPGPGSIVPPPAEKEPSSAESQSNTESSGYAGDAEYAGELPFPQDPTFDGNEVCEEPVKEEKHEHKKEEKHSSQKYKK